MKLGKTIRGGLCLLLGIDVDKGRRDGVGALESMKVEEPVKREIKLPDVPDFCVCFKYGSILMYDRAYKEDSGKWAGLLEEGEIPKRYLDYMSAEENYSNAIERGDVDGINRAAMSLYKTLERFNLESNDVFSLHVVMARQIYLVNNYERLQEKEESLKGGYGLWVALNNPMVKVVSDALTNCALEDMGMKKV